MLVVLGVCVLTAVSSLVALLVWHDGARHQVVAGWGAVANAVAVVLGGLVALGMAGDRVLHHQHVSSVGLWVVVGCFVAQLACSIAVRMSARPHHVPTHVDSEWTIPTASTVHETLLVLEARPQGAAAVVDVITPAGDLLTLPTTVPVEHSRAWIGHRVVAMLSADDARTVLDVFDLGPQPDDELPRQATTRGYEPQHAQEQPAEQQLVEQQPIDQQLLDEQPAEGSLSEQPDATGPRPHLVTAA